MADFDGNRVWIALITGGRDLPERDALNDFSFKSDDEVCAYAGIGRIEIIPVLLCGTAGICHVVNDDIVEVFQVGTSSGCSVRIDELNINPVGHGYFLQIIGAGVAYYV